MNLVDSHDTARILWTLTPGPDNDEAKSDPAALAEGKAKLRLVSAIQLTFPGMASIYYGDEVGLTGFDDPDDRRPYPWGAEDSSCASTTARWHGCAPITRRCVRVTWSSFMPTMPRARSPTCAAVRPPRRSWRSTWAIAPASWPSMSPLGCPMVWS